MKVIIAGSRTFANDDTDLIQFAVDRSGFDVTQVVSGCANGIDRAGILWAISTWGDEAVENGKLVSKPANWEEHGKSAGFIRNSEMADIAEALILIWDGRSSGSAHMKAQMVKRGKPIYELVENLSINSDEHKFRM